MVAGSQVEVERALHGELEPGERWLWSSRPARGLRLTLEDGFGILFLLCFSWPLLSWANAALSKDLSASSRFVRATPLALLVLFMILGYCFCAAQLRARTYYGLTERRLLVVSGALFRRVKAIDLDDLGTLRIERSRGASGTITVAWPASPRGVWRERHRGPQLQLEMLADVEGAYQQIHSAQRARRAANSLA